MRDPIEQLHRIQNAIQKTSEYVKKGRRKFDAESELVLDLQELLGHEVDLVTEKGLHNRIRERVLKEAIPLMIFDNRLENGKQRLPRL